MSTTTAKTIDDAILEIRTTLNDLGINGSAYRFTNATLLQFLNTALREVYSIRPDALIGNFTQGQLGYYPATTFVVGDLGQTPATSFPYDDRIFFSPCVDYVIGRCELGDDEFVDGNRAATLMASFKTRLQGA